MKPWLLILPVCGLWAAFAPTQEEQPGVILITGDFRGYLSPCGCTQPMSGGIKRLATAVQSQWAKDRTVLLVNSGLVSGTRRQDELKLETLAEALKAMGVSAMNLGASEARLGKGAVLSAARLSDDALVSASLQESATNDLPPYALKGPFMIGGASIGSEAIARALGERPRNPEAAAKWLVQQAQEAQAVPVLLFDGGHSAAVALARAAPELKLIIYNSTGNPPKELGRFGQTALATTGEKGKHLVRLWYKDGAFHGYVSLHLLPEFKDDKQVSRLYRTYLGRVSEEKLLEKMPRSPTGAFAGNAVCGSCHKQAMQVWRKSAHAHALKTLEKEGHDRDPDCVSCHVVGVDSKVGFKTRKSTPQLTDVGCESCHGPGKAHAIAAKKIRMPKVGQRSCLPCHTTENSPGFAFGSYWKKIAHK